jgi:hypothetical protein
MDTEESIKFSNISATTNPFELKGGAYLVAVSGTFGGGSVKLQILGQDGSTYLDLKQPFDNAGTEQDDVIGTFSSNGAKLLPIAPGQYRLTITTATAVYASITRAPI